jgi:sugar/nucleoside kinase (ribokinase family)
MSPRLIQLSGVVVDLTYRVEALPAPGHEAIVTGFSISAGGGFNAMVAARRMGLHTAYGGTPGTGPFADITRAALKEAGIPILRPRLAGHDQGVCTVLVEPSGERSFVAAEGADGIVTDADLDGLPLRPGDWLLLSGYTLAYRRSREALTRWLMQRTRRRLVFDPAPLVAQLAPETLRAALGAALWVTANGAEAATITGQADPALRRRRWPSRPQGRRRRGAHRRRRLLAGRTRPARPPPSRPPRPRHRHQRRRRRPYRRLHRHAGPRRSPRTRRRHRQCRRRPFHRNRRAGHGPGPDNRPAGDGRCPARQHGGTPMKTLTLSTALVLLAQTALADEIRVLNWQGYGTDLAWAIADFTAATGHTVVHEYFTSEQEMLTKLRTNPGAYDVVLINSAYTAQAQAEGLLAPIDPAKIPNFADLDPSLARNEDLNPGGALYGVPWTWGLTALAVSNDAFPTPPTSLSVLWDPALKGKVSIRDDGLEAVQFAAMATGQNLNEIKDLDAVKAKLAELMPQITTFWSSENDWNQFMSAGDFVVATYWSGFRRAVDRAGAEHLLRGARRGRAWLAGRAVRSRDLDQAGRGACLHRLDGGPRLLCEVGCRGRARHRKHQGRRRAAGNQLQPQGAGRPGGGGQGAVHEARQRRKARGIPEALARPEGRAISADAGAERGLARGPDAGAGLSVADSGGVPAAVGHGVLFLAVRHAAVGGGLARHCRQLCRVLQHPHLCPASLEVAEAGRAGHRCFAC